MFGIVSVATATCEFVIGVVCESIEFVSKSAVCRKRLRTFLVVHLLTLNERLVNYISLRVQVSSTLKMSFDTRNEGSTRQECKWIVSYY